MINKIIHSIFLGDWLWSDLNKRCHASWKAVLPDWEIMWWRVDDIFKFGNTEEQKWMASAMNNPNGRHAGSNAGAMLRHLILARHGGVLVENDVEILRPIPTDTKCFLGWQRDDQEADSVNAAVFGSEPGHEFHEAYKNLLLSKNPCGTPLEIGLMPINEILRKRGLHGVNVEQDVGDIRIYSKEKFYPWRWDEKPDYSRITPQTIGIHFWEGTWARK